jgi:acyl-homoserine-lactone acylase
MKNSFRFTVFLLLFPLFIQAEVTKIDPNNITIYRDKWGVPHITAPTDEEVAYGLAWATCEDDFKSMQENYLAIHGRLAEVKGKDGAIMDFLAAFVGINEIVEAQFDTAFSPKFRKILSAYAQAVHRYGDMHPEQLLIKNMGHASEKDIIKGYVLGMVLMTGVQFDIFKITQGVFSKNDDLKRVTGSNAIAVRRNKSGDGNTLLAINSHQPLEGPYSWYEAHLKSDEGWNILGGTFPGGMTIFHGVNTHLGWAHTVSLSDLCDTYELEMHPTEKLKYKFDGKWEMLEERKVKMKVKIWFFKIPVTRKYYVSKYGPTLKYKKQFFSLRFPAAFTIKSAEQWYHMNKATNFNEFEQALRLQGAAGLNTIYADREDNIYYLDNGLFPYRDPQFNWKGVLPGNTSATLWPPVFYPFDSLLSVKNPNSGYLFNANNSPYTCTAPPDRPVKADYNSTFGYMQHDNNRAERLQYLFDKFDQVPYEVFKTIKYDLSFNVPAYTYSMSNIDDVFHLDEKKYPDIAESLKVLKSWDRQATKESTAASLVVLSVRYVMEKMIESGNFPNVRNRLSEGLMVNAVRHAQKHLKRYFGTIEVPLGELQRHVRGDVNLPVQGMPDVIAAMDSKKGKKGRLYSDAGESYISMVRFPAQGLPIIETVNAYGASNVPGSPHYTDQMALYVNQKLKPMTLDWAIVIKDAVRVYHPGP